MKESLYLETQTLVTHLFILLCVDYCLDLWNATTLNIFITSHGGGIIQFYTMNDGFFRFVLASIASAR